MKLEKISIKKDISISPFYDGIIRHAAPFRGGFVVAEKMRGGDGGKR